MMSRTGILFILGACIVAGMLIAGCTQTQSTPAVQTTTAAPAATTAPAAAATSSAPAAPAANGTTAATAGAATAGIANPASVNCGKIGGTTEIKTAANGGQYGMCTFANGTSCEEWALFRGEGCKAGAPVVNTTTAAPAGAANAGMANPASVNCGKIGGTTEIKTAADGSQYGMCTFTNGTTCEEWALFRGEGCKAYAAAAATTMAIAASK